MENCWKHIGVWGQDERLTCPELARVIHCRNCEVFTRAGRTLFERAIPQGYKETWTDVLALEKEEELPGTVSVVIFRIEGEWLALSTHVFEEIINVEQMDSVVHHVPHRKNPVLIGVINVHGEIWLCVSLQELLGLEHFHRQEKENMLYKRMMVIQKDGERWVFPVDEIHGIYRIHPNTFQNVPVTIAKSKSTFTKSIFQWDKKQVAFLDDDMLLHNLGKSVK